MTRTQTKEAHSRVQVTYKGTLEECFAGVQSEFTNYPPQGYGTSAVVFYDPFAPSAYIARVTRSESCD